MGVTGLWQVVQPCARPIKIETLNRKRLAVDASIWIYQFLKAVRDKEGNALRNSHVVGFFRRICKLLFIGIKPVFVFDGGAPVLKRQTINTRKARREGRREDAARTAGKLLAVQMQRKAEEEERRIRAQQSRQAEQEEEVPDENLVYAEELLMTEKEKKQNRTFKKKDAYHLPDLDVSLSEMGAPNDPRIMSQEELEDYARQFHTGEDINVYDFSKIDFGSPFFQSLPAADRYNILNAARLRSRLRMGYSKEQLDVMFPDRMAFSKFQIERVKERNELTQRLMNLNGMVGDEFINGTQRVAGERGKEYVLVKNEGVEGGWALGVVSNNKNQGQRNQPIDVEALGQQAQKDEESEKDSEFEDVPMEGINRLPKQPLGKEHYLLGSEGVGQNQQNGAFSAGPQEPEEDPDSLFLADGEASLARESDEDEAVFEDVLPQAKEDDDEDLQRAIAMSLEKVDSSDNEEHIIQTTNQLNFSEKSRVAGRTFAQFTNNRAQSSVTNQPLDNAFANTTARRLSPTRKPPRPKDVSTGSQNGGFSGPLPFESLDLGGSFLRKKKKSGEGGGFEKDKEKKTQPTPPWFAASDVRQGNAAQTAMDVRQMQDEGPQDTQGHNVAVLRRQGTNEVVDVDATQSSYKTTQEPVIVNDSDHGSDIEMGDIRPVEKSRQAINVESLSRMDDLADNVKMNPLALSSEMETSGRGTAQLSTSAQTEQPHSGASHLISEDAEASRANLEPQEDIQWSDSDIEERENRRQPGAMQSKSPGESSSKSQMGSPEPEFEDVAIHNISATGSISHEPPTSSPRHYAVTGSPYSHASSEAAADDEFSDPEDEDLMAQLAAEAEEHARFAASLNTMATKQSAEDYERELRSLRNQQKKDRRDADEVSHIMITECQQLLQLFGLPYITAPMEAEAQCAELVQLGLVDGIVTDDSDIFLFGGTRVYKNMFNQAKYVECYLASDLEKEYGLTREKVIQFSHLLGSDYVEGLPGVGPVSALEIISEFGNLSRFHDWWTEVQSGNRLPQSEIKQSSFQKKFRKNATKIFLPPNFPDPRVDEAYLKPEVDHDSTPFQWGVPDLDALRSFLMSTIGWSRERADEILVPVVRDMNKRDSEGTQSNITRFFSGSTGTGTSRMRGLAGDHGGKQAKQGDQAGEQQADNDATAAAEATASAPGGESFAPRRRVAQGGSKRMATALGKLQAQAKVEQSGEHNERPEENGAIGRAVKTDTGKKRRKVAINEDMIDSHEGSEESDYESEEETGSRRTRRAPKAKKRRG